MFCGNCGNKIPEGAKYCGHCSNKIEINNIEEKHAPAKEIYTFKEKVIRTIEAIVIILLTILAMNYYNLATERYENIKDAFYWIGDFDREIGKLFYWTIVWLVVAECVLCAFSLVLSGKKSEILIKSGISLFADGILLKLGSEVFDDWSDSDASIILYCVFGNFGTLVKITICISLIIIAIGFFMKSVHRPNS